MEHHAYKSLVSLRLWATGIEDAGMGSLVRHGWFASLARARARLAWCGMLGE